MKAKVLKDSIDKQVRATLSCSGRENFLTEILKVKVIEEKDTYYNIEIDDERLVEQEFRKRIWYQSIDKKFGVFRDEEMKLDSTEEKGWRVLFQTK